MKKVLFLGMIALVLTATAFGADVQQVLKTAAKQAQDALCFLEYTQITITGEETQRSGIGVCIDASSGLVMTIAIPPQIQVKDIKNITLTPVGKNDTSLRAKLQGIDTLTGLSFIRCEGSHPFSAVEFLSSANVSPGDLVISAGLNTGAPNTPLALGAGYISSVYMTPNRVYRITGGTLSPVGSIVFNAEGKGIGLVMNQPYLRYQMFQAQRGNRNLALSNLEQTVSFAPVEEFVQALTDIPQDGKARRPNWVGGLLVGVPESLREAKGLTGSVVMFDQVLPGTSADKAGLKNRDVVIGLNGSPIPSLGNDDISASALRQMLARMKPGEDVTLTIQGESGPREVKLKIEPMPLSPSEAPSLYQKELGLLLREKVPFDLAGNDPNAKKSGMLVLAVIKDSPASESNLQQDDLVTAIDGKVVITVNAAEKALKECLDQDPPKDVNITVLRGNTPETVTIKVPQK